MNASAAYMSSPPIRYAFIREMAEHQPVPPGVVARRLKIIALVFAAALLGLAATLLLIRFEAFTTEPARLLAAFAGFATFILMIAAIFSAGLVLWGGYVTQYVAALDAKAQLLEACDIDIDNVSDPLAAPVTAAQASNVLVEMVTGDAVAIVKALEESVTLDRLSEARSLSSDLASFTRRIDSLEHSLSEAQHQSFFAAFRPRFRGTYRVRALLRWRFDETPATTAQSHGESAASHC